MSGKQVAHGKAFEYSVAMKLAAVARAQLADNKPVAKCRSSYESLPPELQTRMNVAAKEAIQFLSRYERERVAIGNSVTIQPDKAGQEGDVRDVLLCQNEKPLFGISAKHRHRSVKHSRLSDTTDFGKEWGEFSVSSAYWEKVKNIFRDLRRQKTESNNQALFRDIRNKEQTIYLPIITAFETELKRLIDEHGKAFCRNMFSYLVGKEDCYQVVANKEKVTVTSFNLGGSLRWGKKWRMPKLLRVERDSENDSSTVIITFDHVWAFSFRLHNATSKIEPSLKFDIKFIGMSTEVHHTHLPFPSS